MHNLGNAIYKNNVVLLNVKMGQLPIIVIYRWWNIIMCIYV